MLSNNRGHFAHARSDSIFGFTLSEVLKTNFAQAQIKLAHNTEVTRFSFFAFIR